MFRQLSRHGKARITQKFTPAPHENPLTSKTYFSVIRAFPCVLPKLLQQAAGLRSGG